MIQPILVVLIVALILSGVLAKSLSQPYCETAQ